MNFIIHTKRLVALVVLVGLLFSQTATAATSNVKTSKAPTGITVSPAFQQIELKESEVSHQLEFSVTNNRPSAETISISSADFNALSETGGLFFVGSNPTDLQKKYGLAKWLELPQSSITIAPKQTVKIKAIINNDSTLAPGGHYGALMLALGSDKDSKTNNNKIAVHPIASSLLFVNKVGGDTHKLKLNNVDVSHSLFKLPSSVTLRFYNDGNTHLTPRGTITLKDPRGKVVSQGIINEDSNLLLPQIFRKYTIPLKQIGISTIPGSYKLTVNFRFDGIDQFRSYQTSFLIIPFLLLLPIFLILAAIVSAIYVFKNKHARRYFLTLIHRRKH